MICKWANGPHVFEFDAKNRADEEKKAREFAKADGFKFSEMVREDSNG